MATFDADLSKCTALVVDGNPTSRSILVTQLREFGVGTVLQAVYQRELPREGSQEPARVLRGSVGINERPPLPASGVTAALNVPGSRRPQILIMVIWKSRRRWLVPLPPGRRPQ